MISQRELERKFNKLLKEVETNDFYTEIDLTNRVNCYVCENGHLTKTKDIVKLLFICIWIEIIILYTL